MPISHFAYTQTRMAISFQLVRNRRFPLCLCIILCRFLAIMAELPIHPNLDQPRCSISGNTRGKCDLIRWCHTSVSHRRCAPHASEFGNESFLFYFLWNVTLFPRSNDTGPCTAV